MAIRNRDVGRPSSGLICFLKKGIDYEIIDESPFWLFLLITIENRKLVIGCVYFRPSDSLITLLEIFEATLSMVLDRFGSYEIYIGGDQNCRIGLLNNLNDSNIFDGSFLQDRRNTLDTIITSRGKLLAEFMETMVCMS